MYTIGILTLWYVILTVMTARLNVNTVQVRRPCRCLLRQKKVTIPDSITYKQYVTADRAEMISGQTFRWIFWIFGWEIRFSQSTTSFQKSESQYLQDRKKNLSESVHHFGWLFRKLHICYSRCYTILPLGKWESHCTPFCILLPGRWGTKAWSCLYNQVTIWSTHLQLFINSSSTFLVT